MLGNEYVNIATLIDVYVSAHPLAQELPEPRDDDAARGQLLRGGFPTVRLSEKHLGTPGALEADGWRLEPCMHISDRGGSQVRT